jgi:DNA-binding response OmpR family regulator
MEESYTILWIGDRHESPEIAERLHAPRYHVIAAKDVVSALEELRQQEIDLIVMENETSCVQGELGAVRLKSAAPRVPILLLCDPLDSGTPQVFFVNLILALRTSPELLLRAIETLVPRRAFRKTGTKH